MSSFSVPGKQVPGARSAAVRNAPGSRPAGQGRGYREQPWQIVARLWTRHQYMMEKRPGGAAQESMAAAKQSHPSGPATACSFAAAPAHRQRELQMQSSTNPPIQTRAPPGVTPGGTAAREAARKLPEPVKSTAPPAPVEKPVSAPAELKKVDLKADAEEAEAEPAGAAAEESAKISPVSADQSVIIIDDDSDENPRQQMPSLPALARVRGSDTFYDQDEPEMYPIKVTRKPAHRDVISGCAGLFVRESVAACR